MSGWILSAFADEYSPAFAEQLTALQGFGISQIELRLLDGQNIADLPPTQVAEVKARLGAAGIAVSAIGSPLGKIRLDGDLAAHYETARRVYATASALGTNLVRGFSFYAPEDRPWESHRAALREPVLEAVGKLCELARAQGVIYCHENEHAIYGESAADVRDLLDALPALGCVFDMGNFVLDGHDPLSAYAKLKDRITYFHIKDAMAVGAIVPTGLGEARIGEILQAHRAYTGGEVLLSIEPHLQTFDGLNALIPKDRSFVNPYQFETKEKAFAEAVRRTKALLMP